MLRLGHEAGAEAPPLNALRRAATVEVDLVIAEVGADRGSAGELGRLTAAQLQRHRMLALVEGEVASPVAVEDRPAVHHLGVEQGGRCQQPVEVAAVPVTPIHHRCDAQPAIQLFQ